MEQPRKWSVMAECVEDGSEYGSNIVTAVSAKDAADWAVTNWLYDASEGSSPFTWTIWVSEESGRETVATFRIKVHRVTTVYAYQEVHDGVPQAEQLSPPNAMILLKFKVG